MSDNPTKEVLEDLLNHLEELESQNGALLLMLKDKGMMTDKEFAPYLEKAGNASNVKRREPGWNIYFSRTIKIKGNTRVLRSTPFCHLASGATP